MNWNLLSDSYGPTGHSSVEGCDVPGGVIIHRADGDAERRTSSMLFIPNASCNSIEYPKAEPSMEGITPEEAHIAFTLLGVTPNHALSNAGAITLESLKRKLFNFLEANK